MRGSQRHSRRRIDEFTHEERSSRLFCSIIAHCMLYINKKMYKIFHIAALLRLISLTRNAQGRKTRTILTYETEKNCDTFCVLKSACGEKSFFDFMTSRDLHSFLSKGILAPEKLVMKPPTCSLQCWHIFWPCYSECSSIPSNPPN